ncbi:isochorismatase family protein [Candidatus Jorgensenbacteria bacterium]|nr:isochorismatase family protein [Candidatus Jorgensenbacteria bacterium]
MTFSNDRSRIEESDHQVQQPRKALIVVDVQNDFCPGGALAVGKGDEVVAPLNKMITYAEEHDWVVVVSRDWHPSNSKHFQKWPPHCIQNTPGARFHHQLDYHGAEVISKAMGDNEDGYSAFDGFTRDGQGMSLEEFLSENDVSEVYVGGLATDYCVKATAIDSVYRGFRTHLLIDACRAVDAKDGDGERAINEMKSEGIDLMTTEEVLRG